MYYIFDNDTSNYMIIKQKLFNPSQPTSVPHLDSVTTTAGGGYYNIQYYRLKFYQNNFKEV